MKIQELFETQKHDADKWYVFDLDTHMSISKGYDQRLHAVNGPEYQSFTGPAESLTVKLGKDIVQIPGNRTFTRVKKK
jgi:hypothetical protein